VATVDRILAHVVAERARLAIEEERVRAIRLPRAHGRQEPGMQYALADHAPLGGPVPTFDPLPPA
jgi:hypothetical protein